MTTMRKRVVIVGGGFGGLATAWRLRKADLDITIIDRRNFHLFQPLLYQVATAGLSPADIGTPIRSILRNQANARVILGKVEAIDAQKRVVHLAGRRVQFDYLVLATGARHAYFGNDHWAALAPGIKTIDDATRLRAKLLNALEQAELESDPAIRKALLTFVVVGGGPTGVELAGAIAELGKAAAARDFREIEADDIEVILVESGQRLLAQFNEKHSHAAAAALQKRGIKTLLGTPVSVIEPDHVKVGERRIDTRSVIWAAGVRASPAGRWLDVPTDRSGRVIVEADFSIPGHEDVFVIGDTAAYRLADGKTLPAVAPAAKQAGQYVGALIAARIADKPVPASFAYRDFGQFATVGRNYAVADFGPFALTGRLGWVVWSVAHVWFLVDFRSRFSVAAQWLWSYFTWERGARLITGAEVAMSATAPSAAGPEQGE